MKTFLAYLLFVAVVAVVCLLLLPARGALGITVLVAFMAGAVFFYYRPAVADRGDAKREISAKELADAQHVAAQRAGPVDPPRTGS